jgi:hypothetical protein
MGGLGGRVGEDRGIFAGAPALVVTKKKGFKMLANLS